MKYLDEYRASEAVKILTEKIDGILTRPWAIMEVCGGQTHAIMRYGIDRLLPSKVELLHGPGCPVCVTPLEMIDKAHAIARSPEVIFCSFGDMLRVPGSHGDLFTLKSQGADVRIVYSPLDAVELAFKNPEKEIVFFAIGFETTAPANAMAAWMAKKRGLRNFTLLVSHVLVPPIIRTLMESEGNRVQGFLGPGHVCTIMGFEEYEPICRDYKIPVVITGFEPVDLLEGIWMTVSQLERSEARLENQYKRVVTRQGNEKAKVLLSEVFACCDRKWRGLGNIPQSGWRLNDDYAAFDAEKRFRVSSITADEPAVCISGEILKGVKKPGDCEAFGKQCHPQNPLGATMVSSEGACAAYYQYARTEA